MSDSTEDSTRRELLRNLGALTLTTFGVNVVSAEAAQHVHNAVSDVKKSAGPYKLKCFTAAEYKTLQRLADIIIPADEHSAGALAAGAPEFIHFLSIQTHHLAQLSTPAF